MLIFKHFQGVLPLSPFGFRLVQSFM